MRFLTFLGGRGCRRQATEMADTLGEVVITARRAEATVTPGVATYRPSATLSGSGGSAFEAISSLPGVSTDAGGSISVEGVRGVTVTIDGRKRALKGAELTSYLKSLPASAVADIQIRTTPSARDDAASTPTVINLRLRKETHRGLSLNAGAGVRTLRGVAGYGNLRASYGTRRTTTTLACVWSGAMNPSRLTTLRPVAGQKDMLSQYYRRTRHDAMANVSGSLRASLTDRITVGATLSYNMDNRRERAGMSTLTPPSAYATLTWNAARFLTRTVHGTAYAVWSLPATDSAIELSADCFGSRGNERQHITSDTSAPEYCATGGDTEGYVGALDYRHTLSSQWQVMAGARVSVVDIKNNGAYAEARARYGVISATAGLRAECTGVRSAFSGG